MTIPDDLLEILVCPESKQPVKLASQQILAELNQKIRARELRNRGGDPVSKPLEAGLVREDGKVLYPIEDDIPVMLVEESIEL
jgi:uncharacterized protein YbaR (Trm112 family)